MDPVDRFQGGTGQCAGIKTSKLKPLTLPVAEKNVSNPKFQLSTIESNPETGQKNSRCIR
jgi:hypothetical protein